VEEKRRNEKGEEAKVGGGVYKGGEGEGGGGEGEKGEGRVERAGDLWGTDEKPDAEI